MRTLVRGSLTRKPRSTKLDRVRWTTVFERPSARAIAVTPSESGPSVKSMRTSATLVAVSVPLRSVATMWGPPSDTAPVADHPVSSRLAGGSAFL